MGTTTNDSIREHVARLLDLGVNQQTLADRMGVSPSWFSRWVNGKGSDRIITVAALDGLRTYIAELSQFVQAWSEAAIGHIPPALPAPRKRGRR